MYLPYDDVKARITIEVRENGSIMVTGAIQNKEYARKVLDGAYDAILRYHASQGKVIIPGVL